MRNQSNRRVWLVALCAAALPALTACGIGQMGNCGAFCGSGKVVRSELGAPPQDPTRGAVISLGGVLKDGHWVWSRTTIERIGELPGQPKVDALRYNPNLTQQQARGSHWFTITWGTNELDPETQMARKGIPIESPKAVPPGLYRLTSRVSFIDKGKPHKYEPFQGKPRTSLITIEAGKTTVLSYRTGVDTSTTPITAWVDVVQLGSAEALELMHKHPNYLGSPKIQIAEPPASAK